MFILLESILIFSDFFDATGVSRYSASQEFSRFYPVVFLRRVCMLFLFVYFFPPHSLSYGYTMSGCNHIEPAEVQLCLFDELSLKQGDLCTLCALSTKCNIRVCVRCAWRQGIVCGGDSVRVGNNTFSVFKALFCSPVAQLRLFCPEVKEYLLFCRWWKVLRIQILLWGPAIESCNTAEILYTDATFQLNVVNTPSVFNYVLHLDQMKRLSASSICSILAFSRLCAMLLERWYLFNKWLCERELKRRG